MRSATSTIFGRLMAFGLLNALDLFLTWRLVRVDGGSVYESNPLARWCLHGGGWPALAAFKATVVLIVAVVFVAITRARPRLGRTMATLGCIVVGGVVLYSAALPRVYGFLPNGRSPDEEAQVERKEALDEMKVMIQAHHHFKNQLVEDVAHHRVSLLEATDLLVASERVLSPRRLEYLRWLYPGHGDRASVAAAFTTYAVVHHRSNPPYARRLWDELARAYRVAFGEPVPKCRTGTYSALDIIETEAQLQRRSL